MDKIERITDSYFYSLVRKPETKKIRKCLSCRRDTHKTTRGERICASCAEKNKRVSARMTDYSGQDFIDFMRDRGAI